ncbi:hypothetical protein B484DRAFT_442076 [Ochromonadaceae sp. CCMP2298]|nr:hypothetical protein B484DRAFT_442076 [Ochromonadaceae sp. CCMP2298]
MVLEVVSDTFEEVVDRVLQRRRQQVPQAAALEASAAAARNPLLLLLEEICWEGVRDLLRPAAVEAVLEEVQEYLMAQQCSRILALLEGEIAREALIEVVQGTELGLGLGLQAEAVSEDGGAGTAAADNAAGTTATATATADNATATATADNATAAAGGGDGTAAGTAEAPDAPTPPPAPTSDPPSSPSPISLSPSSLSAIHIISDATAGGVLEAALALAVRDIGAETIGTVEQT